MIVKVKTNIVYAKGSTYFFPSEKGGCSLELLQCTYQEEEEEEERNKKFGDAGEGEEERKKKKKKNKKKMMMTRMTHRQAMWMVSVNIEMIRMTRRRITVTCAHSVRDNGLGLMVYFLKFLCTQL